MLGLRIVIFIVFGGVGWTRAEIENRNSIQYLEKGSSSPMELWKKICSKSYSSTCLKFDIVSLVDRLSEQNDLGILPGVSIVKQNITSEPRTLDVVANLARDFPDDVDKRMDAYLAHKISSYLTNHAISIKLFDPRTFETMRSLNEATLNRVGERINNDDTVESARKKDKGGYGGMMAGLMMMKGTLGALGFGTLAMLAGKALMTGLMALMLSAIIGLKSLASGEKKTTYEIVTKPMYQAAATSHSFGSEEHHAAHTAGYGRSLNTEAVQEAVRAYGNVRDRRAVRTT